MTQSLPLEVQLEQALKIINVIPEYKFHPTRRWRADYALPGYRLLVEIEGGAWVGGRHTRGGGYIRDLEKYNAAVLLGWALLRFTPEQVEDGSALDVIEQFIKTKDERLGAT